ncbi:uncharacterized protein B0I36DRAFT_312747 [Microdochium trichocladiopsis]|uniref:GIY-YIG domain-containing protein n=1 Tax=Microdochium trichocladiopsis TaxID=1682393 RepID=A0A9P8YJ74_9PEZI|nr:uncharacterized protein B0I36DRAFT_312747 [Microdochium trichocladiopsis]KAH7041389.1 hypothetical protein B0I36DRAFT_312747 [Microdochium trichocladiopsis]
MAGISRAVAADILSHLLNTLEYPPQERHRKRYSSLVEGNEAALHRYLFSCLRPEVLEVFSHQSSLPSWATLRKLNEQGPPPPDAAGVYLNIIRGTDGHDRLYVGQTTRLNQRIFRQHMNFRYRRDNRSLHYHAIEYSSWNNFVVLAVPPPPSGSLPSWLRGSNPQLILNVLEMWCALMFKTLPRNTFEDWLPEKYLDAEHADWFPLNLALPLDQGDHELGATVDWGEALRNANDPLARGYASGRAPTSTSLSVQHEKPAEVESAGLGASSIVLLAFAAGFVAGAFWQKR